MLHYVSLQTESKESQQQELSKPKFAHTTSQRLLMEDSNSNNLSTPYSDEQKVAPVAKVNGTPLKTRYMHFQQWVEDNHYKYHRRADERTNVTFSSMEGYIVELAQDKKTRRTAYENLARDFTNAEGRVSYNLSETVFDMHGLGLQLPVFLFQELDFPYNDRLMWDFAKQQRIAQVYCGVLREFMLGEHLFHVYLSLKRPVTDENVEVIDGDRYQPNIHLQTDICTTLQIAQRVHAMFIDRLRSEFHFSGAAEWEQIVDPLVLTKNRINLRLNYSHKLGNCNFCEVRKGPPIGGCQNTQCDRGKAKVLEFYRVVRVFNRLGEDAPAEFERIRYSIAKELEATSIRPYPQEPINPYFVVPRDCPEALEYHQPRKDFEGALSWGNRSDQNKLFPKSGQTGKAWVQKSVELRQYEGPWNAILWAIKQCHPGFLNASISRIRAKEMPNGKQYYIASLRGRTARFCTNRLSDDGMTIGAFHSHSTGKYFELKEGMLIERCSAGNTEEKRVAGACSKMHKIYSIDIGLSNQIWPPAPFYDDPPVEAVPANIINSLGQRQIVPVMSTEIKNVSKKQKPSRKRVVEDQSESVCDQSVMMMPELQSNASEDAIFQSMQSQKTCDNMMNFIKSSAQSHQKKQRV